MEEKNRTVDEYFTGTPGSHLAVENDDLYRVRLGCDSEGPHLQLVPPHGEVAGREEQGSSTYRYAMHPQTVVNCVNKI